MAPLRYSPRPREDYSVEWNSGRVGLGRHPFFSDVATWNLFWLLEPRLDGFLTGAYKADDALVWTGLVDACQKDTILSVGEIPVSQLLSARPPIECVAALLACNSSEFETVKLLGWSRWASRLLTRAQLSGIQTGRTVEAIANLREYIGHRLKPTVELVRAVDWLASDQSVSRHTAKELVRACIWWLKHPSGGSVRAPGHAENLEQREDGWILRLGANSWLVSKALSRARGVILRATDTAFTGRCPSRSDVYAGLRYAIAASVANYDDVEYEGIYPARDGKLVFGVHAIDLDDAIKHLVSSARIEGLLDD